MRLSDLVRRALSSVLAKRSPDGWHEGDLRAALQLVCERARDDGLRAEQLLLVIKTAWRDLAEESRMARVESDEELARVVTACIEEYYGGDSTPQRGREEGALPLPRLDPARFGNAELR